MNKCIDSIGLIEQKANFERQIARWQDTVQIKDLQKVDFVKMASLYEQRTKASEALLLFSETFSRNDELSSRAQRIHNGATPVGNGKRQHINIKDNSDTWDLPTDREILGMLLANYRSHVTNPDNLPAFYTNVIDKKFNGNCQAYADAMYKKSILIKKNRVYPNKKSNKKDLGVQYGLDLVTLRANLIGEYMAISDSIDEQERRLCDVKVRMEMDQPHYSDANFTLRLSYGQVKEYLLAGKPSGFRTTAPSMVAKMKTGDTVEDYRVEPEMLQLMSEAGDMPLCFLTTNDITGGNSGSPMFDGKNRLIGLAFDGNWDSLSSDIFFDRDLARCIGVDIRYVLFMMDKWGHADRLIKEINAK